DARIDPRRRCPDLGAGHLRQRPGHRRRHRGQPRRPGLGRRHVVRHPSPLRQLLRREPDGRLVTHAQFWQLNPTRGNDIAVDSRATAFVGGIGFEFPGGEYPPGLLAVVTPDGVARTVADGLAFPNGMVVTGDDATLIVAESYGNRLTAFDIAADGTLSHRRVW